MAKKKKQDYKAPVPMTRGQLSRAKKEQQQIRNLYTAGIALGVVIVLLLGFAVFFQYVLRPNSQVASVNGTSINRAAYNKLRSWNLFQQLQQAVFSQQFGQDTTGAAGDQITQLMQQMASVESESSLDQQTVQTLVDNEVLRQKSAQDFQINPTTQELKDFAIKDFVPEPTPPPSSETPTAEAASTITITATPTHTSTITPSPTATATRGTPTATPTVTATFPPVPGAQQTAEAVYSKYVTAIKKGPQPAQGDAICSYGCPDLSEQDYLTLVIDPRLRQQQVTDKLAATGVMTEVEQIRASHILTDTEEGAKAIRQRLEKGDDFGTVAVEMSSDPTAKDNLGDVGWFAKEGSNLDQAFVDGAWPLKVGEISQPVKSSFGWHIIKVTERDPHRALTTDQITAKKNQLYTDWFNKAKAESQISPSFAQAPTPTPPPLVEPTSPASNPTATTGGSGGSGASGTVTGTVTTETPTGTGSSSSSDTNSGSPATPTGSSEERVKPTATSAP